MIFLGVHSDGEALKLAKIRKENKNITIDLLRTHPLVEEGSIVNPLYNVESSFGKDCKIITGLEASEVFIRILQMKLLDKRKVLAALPFQLEGLVPFPLSEAFICPQITKDLNDSSSRVQVTAVKETLIENHLEKIKTIGIDPDFISCAPSALTRFYSFFFPEKPDAFLFHIGSTSSAALLFSNGKMEVSYPFSFGMEDLIQALSLDFPESSRRQILERAYSLDIQEIGPSDSPHLFETLFNLQKEIDRIISFFQSKPSGKNCESVILTGYFSCLSRFRDFFTSSLPSSFRTLSAPALGTYDESTIESYALPIGLALDAAIQDGNSLQLRQKRFISELSLRKKTKSLALYFGAAATLSLSLFLGSHLILAKKEKCIQKLCSTYFPETSSAINLEMQIASIEKKLGKQKKNSSLILPIASVSEVLTWISCHPKLSRSTDSLIDLDLIEVKKVRYEIVKCPKLNGPPILPLVKLEVEFVSPSTRIARDFHDSLLKGDSIVDEKKEITWNVTDSVYRTSFFVKPKGDSL